MKDLLLKEWNDVSFRDLPKRWSSAHSSKDGLTEFERKSRKDNLNESKRGEYANIYDMKKEIGEGKFDPKNPTVAVTGLGVYNLRLLEKVIKRDVGKALNDLGFESGINNLMYHLYKDKSPLQSKIKGLSEVYEQMNSPAFKKAVTLYKRK